MTKKELIEALKDLPDDTLIRVPEVDDNTYATVAISCVDIECDGSDGCQAEVCLY